MKLIYFLLLLSTFTAGQSDSIEHHPVLRHTLEAPLDISWNTGLSRPSCPNDTAYVRIMHEEMYYGLFRRDSIVPLIENEDSIGWYVLEYAYTYDTVEYSPIIHIEEGIVIYKQEYRSIPCPDTDLWYTCTVAHYGCRRDHIISYQDMYGNEIKPNQVWMIKEY